MQCSRSPSLQCAVGFMKSYGAREMAVDSTSESILTVPLRGPELLFRLFMFVPQGVRSEVKPLRAPRSSATYAQLFSVQPDSLPCARRLHVSFSRIMFNQMAQRLLPLGRTPQMKIAHVMWSSIRRGGAVSSSVMSGASAAMSCPAAASARTLSTTYPTLGGTLVTGMSRRGLLPTSFQSTGGVVSGLPPIATPALPSVVSAHHSNNLNNFVGENFGYQIRGFATKKVGLAGVE